MRHAVKAAVALCRVDGGIREPTRFCLGLLRIDVEVNFDGVLLDVDNLAFQGRATDVVVADGILPDACFGHELVGVNEKGMVDPDGGPGDDQLFALVIHAVSELEDLPAFYFIGKKIVF